MIKLSVNETKWSSFLGGTRVRTLYISIWIFDLGPEKLPGRSRNGPQVWKRVWKMTDFSLSGLENRAAHPHQEFPGVPPPGSSLWLQHQQETTQLYDFCMNKIFTKQKMKKTKKNK